MLDRFNLYGNLAHPSKRRIFIGWVDQLRNCGRSHERVWMDVREFYSEVKDPGLTGERSALPRPPHG